ncbi:hypothetical protein BDV96DRAFT_119738 [Lophiotrema nucula]|uniref:Rhodopsin domain-containing protein n=1 Tax=Lophiotrema nucula TaxID=690887 RepID=A0A6A5Z2K6_9PLEO|nr:hypothetical protein BDV96DRAFT_119738 [Lophiotrema nucula]
MMMLMGTQGPVAFWVVTTLLTALCILVVLLRAYARGKQRQPFRVDDWLILPALLITLGISAAIWAGIAQGSVGYPAPMPTTRRSVVVRTPIDQVSKLISRTEKVYFAVLSLACLNLAIIKLSILFFYRRIFVNHGNKWGIVSIIITTLMVLTGMWGIAFTFSVVFSCKTHFSYWWASAGAELRLYCIDTQMLMYGWVVSGFIMDCLILVIPVPLVWRLHLETKRKIGVIAIFLTGSIAIAASAIKLAWLVWENHTPWNPGFDQNLLGCSFMFWIMVENHVGLIAACLPTLRAVVKDHSMDSVLRSIRSKMSLTSHASRTSQRDSLERISSAGSEAKH